MIKLSRFEHHIGGKAIHALAPRWRYEKSHNPYPQPQEPRQRNRPAKPPRLIKQITHLARAPAVACEKVKPILWRETKWRVAHEAGAHLFAVADRLGRIVVDDPIANLLGRLEIVGKFRHVGLGQTGSDPLGEHQNLGGLGAHIGQELAASGAVGEIELDALEPAIWLLAGEAFL